MFPCLCRLLGHDYAVCMSTVGVKVNHNMEV